MSQVTSRRRASSWYLTRLVCTAKARELYYTVIRYRVIRRKRTDWRRRAMLLGTVPVVAGVLVGAHLYGRGNGSQTGFRTVKVERGSLTATVATTGTLNAVVTVQVGTQISGQIKELFADFNTRVTKGQLIARIEPAIFETKVVQARADVEAAEANVLTQRAQVERARADVENARAALASAKAQTAKAEVALRGPAEGLLLMLRCSMPNAI